MHGLRDPSHHLPSCSHLGGGANLLGSSAEGPHCCLIVNDTPLRLRVVRERVLVAGARNPPPPPSWNKPVLPHQWGPALLGVLEALFPLLPDGLLGMESEEEDLWGLP